MNDTFKHQALRKRLVQEIKDKGIKDTAVLQGIEKIPRHLFMDSAFQKFAYEDSAFPIGDGQTISQPYTVAFQTTLLEVKKGDKVLEIGTGSGYQSAVLDAIGAKVFSVERHKKLHDKAAVMLKELNCSTKCFYGDGYKGLPTFAPFDRVIVTAAAPYIPTPLLEQLKPGGILVIPVGEGNTQIMKHIKKLPDNTYITKDYGNFSFVPMINTVDWQAKT
ncbi:MAG TPA: protein-L-isoaspartate(D-aspartate) O-methyltransferase [Bacteroidia bacterium]|jgi:protein-L-isoaspartate(D-aspartate) O-methyltransferase|nr:protein-L-isoaspartate(D-aspartate) O-methyltransferase [Bacteroidia bacterium]